MYGRVTDVQGKPLANAQIDIWQTASNGLYDIQSDPSGAMDSRGIFTTDANGNYLLRTVAPLDYSIPMDGPVGEMVKAQKRHGMRPAHIHLLISAPGHRELVTALYLSTSNYLATDVVFGSSSEDLVAEVRTNDPNCPIKGMRVRALRLQAGADVGSGSPVRPRRLRSLQGRRDRLRSAAFAFAEPTIGAGHAQ